MLRSLYFLVGCACSLNTYASLITYNYTANLSQLHYIECFTYSLAGDCIQRKDVYPDTMPGLSGTELVLGDTISGSFTYDPNTSISYFDGPRAAYSNSIGGMSINIGEPDLELNSGAWIDMKLVNDSPIGQDNVLFRGWFGDGRGDMIVDVVFADNTANLVDSYDLPSDLSLDDFSYTNLNISVYNPDYFGTDFYFVQGSFTALYKVPEPHTLALFFVGLIGLCFRRVQIVKS